MLKVAKNKNLFRLGILVISGLLIVYCVGYAVCRRSHNILHTSACAADKYSFHDVVEGDTKFASPNYQIALFYTPLRYLEKHYWHSAKPIGSVCL